MLRACKAAGFFLALTLSALGSSAQEPKAADVRVEYAYPALTIRVSQPTDLQTVMEAICQRTETDCQIAPGAAQVVVPPVVVTGSWAEVLGRLFEGTRLGYGWTVPILGRIGRLLVIPSSEVTDLPAPMAEKKREARRMPNREVESSPSGQNNPGQPVAADNNSAQREELSTPSSQAPQGAEALDPGPPLANKRRAIQQESNQESSPNTAEDQAREAAVWAIITGKAVDPSAPASAPGTITLPVPDPNGNPIVIPTTRQGLTELPFPDPEGRPIPVTPLPRGQSVSTPFPLNPQSTK